MINLFLDHALKTSLLAVLSLACRQIFYQQLTGRQRLYLWLPLIGRAILPFSFLPPLSPILVFRPDLVPPQPDKALLYLALAIYIAGALFMAGRALLLQQRLHKALLAKARPRQITGIGLPVYESSLLPSACLSKKGKKQIIFIHPDLLADRERSHHILMHELSHAQLKDPLWHRLRILLLIIHWYNPLVWYVAALLLLDSECACDQYTVSRLGQQQLAPYARTLYSLLPVATKRRPQLLCQKSAAWTNRQELKIRLLALARLNKTAQKNLLFPLILSLLLLALLFSFTGPAASGSLVPALPALSDRLPQMTQFP